jgi:hypothetical protein
MNKVAIYQVEGSALPTNINGFVFSNSFDTKAGLVGVFSLGAGFFDGGFADDSNANNPLYQSIIGSKCTLRNIFITLCRFGTLNGQTGLTQDLNIYQNGSSVVTISLDGTTDVLFPQQSLDISFERGDLISFSLDNTSNVQKASITLHTYFENA